MFVLSQVLRNSSMKFASVLRRLIVSKACQSPSMVFRMAVWPA